MPDQQKSMKQISAERVITISFLVDISDALINIIIAVLTGSVTMLSQALEGFADLISSSLLLIGIKLSKKPADSGHPYGYGREVYFWSFLSGLTTFGITATLSFWWGLQRFLHPEPVQNLVLAYAALIIAIMTNGYALSLSYRRLLKKRRIRDLLETFMHSTLIETKTTFVLDLMGTLASILGLIALLIYGYTGNLRFDGIGAMAIGLTLAAFAFLIVKGARELLVGQSAPLETEDKIRSVTTSFDQVEEVLDLRTLLIGPEQLLVNMEVHLTDKLSTDEIEQIIDKLEQEIRQEVPFAKHIQIELETPDV